MANFGLFLVDDKGMTLYLYTKDTPNTSNCYDQCAAAWPPFLTNGAPLAGTGITPSLLGTTTRKDGKTQVTYNGNPLYYFAKDQKPGDIAGQGVGGVWFVLSPRGAGMTSSKAPGQGTPQASSVIKPQPTPAGPVTLKVSQTDQLGQFLVDDKGMTLYLYTKDTPNTSNCYDICAVTWPPLYTNGAPVAGAGVDASLLGTTTRTDGTVQVTYKGWPLYYWFRDQKPGDTTGQWVGGTWFVISPKGETITAGKPPATATPAATTAPTAARAAGGQRRQPPRPRAPVRPVSVAISNNAFAPKTLTVAPGTTVVWKNGDSVAHTVTADNGAFDSGNMEQGATASSSRSPNPAPTPTTAVTTVGLVDRAWPARSSSSKRPGSDKLVCHEQAPHPAGVGACSWPYCWKSAVPQVGNLRHVSTRRGRGTWLYNMRPAAIAW